MQPPPRCCPRLPLAFFFGRPDEDRDHRPAATEGSEQRRIVGQTQIVTKPEQGCVSRMGTTGSKDFGDLDELDNRRSPPGRISRPRRERVGPGAQREGRNEPRHASEFPHPLPRSDGCGARGGKGHGLARPRTRWADSRSESRSATARAIRASGAGIGFGLPAASRSARARGSESPSRRGVIASRFRASAKKANTSSIGWGIHCSRCKKYGHTFGIIISF